MGESNVWRGHQLSLLPDGESWLTGGRRASEEPAPLIEPAPPPAPPVNNLPANKSWLTTAVLAVLGVAALITIFVARGSGKVHEPAPLPEPPGHVITALHRGSGTTLRIHVGEYIRLALPAASTYSTVVEQPTADESVITDLKLPGQQPQLRADTIGHAIVEVMAQPVCTGSDRCSDVRTLTGTLDITVTP